MPIWGRLKLLLSSINELVGQALLRITPRKYHHTFFNERLQPGLDLVKFHSHVYNYK